LKRESQIEIYDVMFGCLAGTP